MAGKDVVPIQHDEPRQVVDVPVRPIYGDHWKSGIHLGTVLGPLPWVLLRASGTEPLIRVMVEGEDEGRVMPAE